MTCTQERCVYTCHASRCHFAVFVFLVVLLLPALSAFPQWDVRKRAEANDSSDYLSLSNPTDADIDALGNRPVTHLVAYLGDDDNGLSIQGIRRLLNRDTLVDIFVSAVRTNVNDVLRNLPAGLRHFATLDTLRDPQLALLAELPHLKTLAFQFNGTGQGLKELKKLRSIENLNLKGFGSGRMVDDEHYAAVLGEWKELRYLRFAAVKVGASTLATLAGLEHVHEIELQSISSITVADLALLQKAPALKKLFLGKCDALDDSVWTELPEFECLESLELQNCPTINPVLLHELGRCPALMSLSIRSKASTHVSSRERPASFQFVVEHDAGPRNSKRFERLTQLTLENQDSLDEAAFRYIVQSNRLKSVDISDCRSLTPEALFSLVDHESLEQLAVFRMKAFTSSVLLALAKACPLHEIELTFVQGFDDSVAVALHERNSCRSLVLLSCRALSSSGLLSIAGIKTLQRLIVVRGCRNVTVEICRALGRLPNLYVLNLNETDITDEGVQQLAASRSLAVVGLHHCDISTDAVRKLLAGGTVKKIGLFGCPSMTPEALEKLRQSFPDCTIIDE